MASSHLRSLVSLCLLLSAPAGAAEPDADQKKTPASITFDSIKYLHRWSNEGQHEYTPKGQEDLEKWADMVTLHHYASVNDGDGLASMANAVLENYKKHGAKVVRTDSVPRTDDKEAEHLIVVLFPRPKFIEAVFARFKMSGKKGGSIIYSHRVHGEKSGPAMSAWLKENGPGIEKKLMGWKG